MTTIKNIMDYFESFAPVSSAMEFDNVGLLIGDKDACIKKALVTLDITSDVVLEAEKLGCELIISHHPVIFSPVKRLSKKDVPYMLISKGISALCMHTNLDLGEEFGVNICLANAIGVKNPVKSELGECMFIGELDNEIEMKAFAQNVKTALLCEGLRYTENKNSVKKVAVASGSGGSDIFSAVAENVDVLVVGEIKHHEINFANEAGINIIDAGHFKSEDVVTSPLVKRLSAEFSDIIFTKSKTYSDNIKFI